MSSPASSRGPESRARVGAPSDSARGDSRRDWLFAIKIWQASPLAVLALLALFGALKSTAGCGDPLQSTATAQPPQPVPTVSVPTSAPSAESPPAAETATSTAETPPVVAATGCPASLPTTVPADLAIGMERHVLPHGRDVEVYAGELVARKADCREPAQHPCTVIPAAKLASVWKAFRDRKFTELRSSDQGYMSPHYGSRHLWLSWGTTRCEVDDEARKRIEPASSEAFSALLELVNETGQAYSKSSP
jgi:hypothetical protein